MARIVVVGAGVAGMATAARLRVKGHQVTVVEAAPTVGGALTALRREGFTFDLGPSVFTLPAVYRDLFLKTGDALEKAVELVPLEPGTRHRFVDAELTLPGVGVGSTAEAIGAALGERAAEDWRALMSRAGRMWAALRRPVLETPLTCTDAAAGTDPLTELMRDRTARRTLAPRRSLHDLARQHLRDPRARHLLEHYALQAGADPRQAPATLATLPYVEATFGTWHLGSGLATLADALRARLDERGVTLLLGTRATRILVDQGRVSGVLLEPAHSTGSAGHTSPADAAGPPDAPAAPQPESLPADIVVTDIDPAVVHRELLAPDTPAPTDRRGQPTRPSAGAFQVLLAVRGRTPGVGHTTVWHPEDPDAELDAVFGRRPRPPARPTIRASVPDDPAMRPAGHEAWTLQVTTPGHSPGAAVPGTLDWDTPDLAQRYADDLLAELARRGGPDLRDRILWRDLRTPADHQRSTGSPTGATHGSTTGPRGSLQAAPNTAAVPGLFHVGASAHPGPGLPMVGLSAELVATLIGRA